MAETHALARPIDAHGPVARRHWCSTEFDVVRDAYAPNGDWKDPAEVFVRERN